MNLVLKTNDGRWTEAMITTEVIPEDTAQRWADASCETLGQPPGTMTPVFFADGEPDPRTGVLLAEPPPIATPPPPPPSPSLADVIAAELPKVRADPALNAASKAAIDVIVTAAKRD